MKITLPLPHTKNSQIRRLIGEELTRPHASPVATPMASTDDVVVVVVAVVQIFDALIVVASFVLDLVFLKGVTNSQGDETVVLIMIFLLWRILRIINGEERSVINYRLKRLIIGQVAKGRAEGRGQDWDER